MPFILYVWHSDYVWLTPSFLELLLITTSALKKWLSFSRQVRTILTKTNCYTSLYMYDIHIYVPQTHSCLELWLKLLIRKFKIRSVVLPSCLNLNYVHTQETPTYGLQRPLLAYFTTFQLLNINYQASYQEQLTVFRQ